MGPRQRRRPGIESEGETGMRKIVELLAKHPAIADYKINIHEKESCELFFVKGKLETVRRTDTCDKEVTVYVDHDGFRGDAQFLVYASTTEEQLSKLIEEAVEMAKLISNAMYTLPENETGDFEVESNFKEYDAAALAELTANTVFAANTVENGTLNSVEVFINKHKDTVLNSRGLHKTQVRYDAMAEAIPTYNGKGLSVELYEQYNFNTFDAEAMTREIAGKMAEVKARYEAVRPDFEINCKVVLNKRELSGLFARIASNLNYASVYAHANIFSKGDLVQKAPTGDLITITGAGAVEGCCKSTKFDTDGLSLGSIVCVADGKVVNYYGSNRFGQYLGEKPTGDLQCICVKPGTAKASDIENGPYMEIISTSGMQVDFFNDYIGGEVRLAYYHDGEKVTPITGISVAGKLSDVLNSIELSENTIVSNGYSGYFGPEKAVLHGMKVF